MDIKIRFCCDDKCKVTTKYHNSKFLARGNAETIISALIETLDGLDNRNCFMLSMDGPNTEWSVLDKMSTHHQQTELPSFFDVGCCGLHTVHGAFQTGAVATNWLLDKVLHGMWKLFKDSPPRRGTYTVTHSEDFPLSFCKTRWVEDEKVAAKAVKIWPNIVQVVKHYEGLAPSKCPRNNKSHDALVKHADDKLMPAKLQFFGDVAHMFSELLRGFQTNIPMVPFPSGSLETMIRRVMKMFIKEDVLNEAVTAFQLIKIKVSETSNQLAIGGVKLTTATEALLKSCSVDKVAKENFRRDCVTFLLRMV